MRKYNRQSQLSTTKPEEATNDPVSKKQRYYFIRNSHITFLSVVLLQNKFTFLFILQTFLKLTIRSFTINAMQVTVSNNGKQWILDFGPDSVV